MSHPMDKYPKAPKETIELLTKAFEQFAKDNDCDVNTLVTAYNDCYDTDGYEIAKRLDNFYGWDIDSEWVEKLDDLAWLASDELKKQREQWFNENNIDPPYEIGTKLDKGTIVGIDTYYSGYYLVEQHNDSIGKLLLKFEDARLV